MEQEFYIGLTRNVAGDWVWMDGSMVDFVVSYNCKPCPT